MKHGSIFLLLSTSSIVGGCSSGTLYGGRQLVLVDSDPGGAEVYVEHKPPSGTRGQKFIAECIADVQHNPTLLLEKRQLTQRPLDRELRIIETTPLTTLLDYRTYIVYYKFPDGLVSGQEVTITNKTIRIELTGVKKGMP